MPSSAPRNEDLTVENLTPHVLKISTNVKNERIRLIFSKLIQHSHDFVRETGLTTAEWEAAWQYLTKVGEEHAPFLNVFVDVASKPLTVLQVGQKCTPDRQEMILLSDILGISALVDAINHPRASSATESSVLGPFHNDAHEFVNGQSISSTNAIGEPMLIRGSVSDIAGNVVSGAKVDVWHTNGNGFYDMQDPEKEGPDCRGIFHTDSDGKFALIGVRPVDYPIPSDGPVGVLLRLLSRPIMRPAHVVCCFVFLEDANPFTPRLDLPPPFHGKLIRRPVPVAFHSRTSVLHQADDCTLRSCELPNCQRPCLWRENEPRRRLCVARRQGVSRGIGCNYGRKSCRWETQPWILAPGTRLCACADCQRR